MIDMPMVEFQTLTTSQEEIVLKLFGFFLNFILFIFLYSRFLLVIHFILLVYICQSQSPNSSHYF